MDTVTVIRGAAAVLCAVVLMVLIMRRRKTDSPRETDNATVS